MMMIIPFCISLLNWGCGVDKKITPEMLKCADLKKKLDPGFTCVLRLEVRLVWETDAFGAN